MTVMVEATVLEVVQIVLLLMVLGLQVRARFDRAKAREVAKDTKSEAAYAAVEAKEAAGTSRRVLHRIDETGAGTAESVARVEAAVVSVEDSEDHQEPTR